MAQYIIDIPDEEETMWEGFNGDLFIPITMNKGTRTWVNTDLKMTPYTEPDREAIENEVWEFAWKMFDMDFREYSEMFDDNECPSDYRKARAKYEAWKQEKEEIRVGDEVIYNSRTRAVVLEPETNERYGTILATNNLFAIAVSHDYLEKTGRHFDSVEKLLEEMRKSDG